MRGSNIMAFRQLLNSLSKKSRPIVFGIASSYIQLESPGKPNADDKIHLGIPDIKSLSFDYMIKQSTIEVVNSVTQILTVSFTAIEATSKEYRELLSNLICLMQETLMREVDDTHWDMIITLRLELQKKKLAITKLVGYIEYVQKMAVATSEVSFLSDMDNLSDTLCQRIDDAMNNTQREVAQNKMMEEEYTRVQEKCILRNRKQNSQSS